MASIKVKPFGALADGRQVKLFIISDGPLTAHILEYGVTLQKLVYQQEDGTRRDLVLGYDTLAEYEAGRFYFGATIGRYSNRIRGGRFSVDGREYILPQNEEGCTLHGGEAGFSKRLFSGIAREDELSFALRSPDGEGGFPGNLAVEVRVSLRDGALRFDYLYMSDRDTPVSMTHHSYFNLNGEGSGSAADHYLRINASRYLKLDRYGISVAPYVSVAGTPFDFTCGKPISQDLGSRASQMRVGKGYDHCFVPDSGRSGEMALLRGDKSGIEMQVFSDLPGLQFYDGSGIGREAGVSGKDGKVYRRRYGVCLEPQFFPDSPNEPDLPAATGRAGELCHRYVSYAFSA